MPDPCPDELTRERFLVDELDVKVAEIVASHREDCPTCREWFEEAESDQEVLASLRLDSELGPRPPQIEGLFDAQMLGQYRILGRLGAGGMGIVYEAEQRAPRRRVALKVLGPGYGSDQLLRRFRFEAEVLGLLDHPGIARIYEAGTFGEADDPRPFFAMELVRGEPLDGYVAAQDLGLEERLRLFARICEAVAYAHEKGVIHRDLKPSNILVSEEGRPKILDFGVARVTDANLRPDTLRTTTGQIVGTLAYMSPEQVEGDPEAVDLRCDVYSLGVIYYELLTGRRPHDLRGQSVTAGVRTILEQTPPRMGDLSPNLRGDLETIGRKALEKEPAQRFASASAFAEDVTRFLDQEPITARPPSAVYQITRFAQRHRTLVIAGCLIALTMLFGAATTIQEWSRRQLAQVTAEYESDRAEAEAANSLGLSDFLVDVVALTSPDNTERLTIDEVFARAVARIDREYAGKPLVRAELHHTAGLSILRVMGRGFTLAQVDPFEVAEHHLRTALAIWEEEYGLEHPKIALALETLGVLELIRRNGADAEPLLRRSLSMLQGSESPAARMASVTSNLGRACQQVGDTDEAEMLLREALAISRSDPRERPADRVLHLDRLARFLAATEQGHAEADQLSEEAVDHGERHHSDLQHREHANRFSLRGVVLVQMGRDFEGLEFARTAVMQDRALGYLEGPRRRDLLKIARTLEAREDNSFDGLAARAFLEVLFADASYARPLAEAAQSRGGDRSPAAMHALARTWIFLDEPSRAEELLLLAHAESTGPPVTQMVAADLVLLYESLGKQQEAAAFRAEDH